MTNATLHHARRSIRLPGYDYTLPGGYFVTIVTGGRKRLFGDIENGEMVLSAYGRIALEQWFKTAALRRNVELRTDEFVVMPNHVHGIIWIIDDLVGAERRSAPTAPQKGSLGVVVRAYKSAVTYAINAQRGVRDEAVWQRNYYEHILRSQDDWERACAYIQSNPSFWADDDENPDLIISRGKK